MLPPIIIALENARSGNFEEADKALRAYGESLKRMSATELKLDFDILQRLEPLMRGRSSWTILKYRYENRCLEVFGGK